MGKWNRRYMSRPRRRNYHDYQWSPPRDEPCPDPETETWQDNVPMWEKKFCYLVGRMPWKKVLSTKNFMHCYSNVLNWDDDAGAEAFHAAKKRFWDEINGYPSETQLPNPNLYIDEIDWNPYMDPNLIMELDQDYFNADDKYHSPSSYSKGKNRWADDECNLWEPSGHCTPAAADNATGWDQWDDQPENGGNDKLNSLVKNKEISPHPCDTDGPYDVDKNPDCGGGDDSGWNSSVRQTATGLNQWDSYANDSSKLSENAVHKDNTSRTHLVNDSTNNGWGDGDEDAWNKPCGSNPQNQWDNSWRNQGEKWQRSGKCSSGWNQRKGYFGKPMYPNYSYKPQDYGSGSTSYHRRSGVPNGRGHKPWDNFNRETRDSTDISRGRGHYKTGWRKREGPDQQYATNHKGPKMQGDDFHSSRHWANNRRVGYGGRWS